MSTILSRTDSARTGSSRPLVEGEYALTIENVRAMAAMLHADSGIALSEAKATLVYSRLVKRLRTLGLDSFGEYCALVAAPAGGEERRQMLTALTTNVTRFFREPHHFEHLKTAVLPALLKEARRGGKVRLWSAACSTGQEPYSIALTILSLMPDAAGLDVRILATDIDPAVLAEGRAGVYDEASIAAVPSNLRQRWFTRASEDEGGNGWRVADEARRLVAFRELNLIGSWPMKGRFHAIMCRNVVIYFEDDTQAKVWNRFMPLVEPGGHLYIGHSERLTGEAARHFESAGITTYRRHPESRS